jgi:two-component system sensor histidine kinase RegB
LNAPGIPQSVSLAPATVNLRRLVGLRAIAIASQAVAVGVAIVVLGMVLPIATLIAILAVAATVNVFTWLRTRRPWPVREVELFAHLVFDVLALTVLLYYTGGSTNPFAPLYLLPLTLTAAALPWRYTWAMVGITAVCYSLLLFVYLPLPQEHGGHGGDFHLHVLGMWLGFMLSAGLIAHFAVRMAATLRERDQLAAQMRERALRDHQVLALGTLAAGAAHELSTPLSTVAVLASELERAPDGPPERWRLLRAQLMRCREILTSLSAATGQARAEGGRSETVDRYLQELVQRWQTGKSGIVVQCALAGTSPAPRIVVDQTLSHAILNMLNNAADASPEHVEIDAHWTASLLSMEIRDRGTGMPDTVRERAGEPFFTTKAPGAGMGLGLFLARNTLERLGGSVALLDRPGGGTVCRVELPLTPLRVDDA